MAVRRHVVVLGAGFGGAHAALELARLREGDPALDVTLVNEHNYLLYTPMLTEVVGGQVDPRHIASPSRKLSPHVQFVQGRVQAIDLRSKTVTLVVGESDAAVPDATRTLQADQMVIALGSTSNFHHLPGVPEHALTVKDIGDAGRIRNRALALLERAAAEPDAGMRQALLTFVVAGGGFSGVETMAALNDLVRDASQFYPAVERGSIRMVLAHHGDRLLPELGADLAHYAHRHLSLRGVEVRLHAGVARAGDGFVELANGERIPTWLLVWAGGIKPSPVVQALECQHGRHGGLVVDRYFRVPGFDGLWAVGDCAEVPKPGGASYAPTGQNAEREGKLAGQNIAAVLRGQPLQPFTYRPIGELALIGKHTGVGSVFGLKFRGLAAWAMWRAAYLSELPGWGKRGRVLMDWLLDLTFGIEIVDLPLSRERATRPPAPAAEPAPTRELAHTR